MPYYPTTTQYRLWAIQSAGYAAEYRKLSTGRNTTYSDAIVKWYREKCRSEIDHARWARENMKGKLP